MIPSTLFYAFVPYLQSSNKLCLWNNKISTIAVCSDFKRNSPTRLEAESLLLNWHSFWMVFHDWHQVSSRESMKRWFNCSEGVLRVQSVIRCIPKRTVHFAFIFVLFLSLLIRKGTTSLKEQSFLLEEIFHFRFPKECKWYFHVRFLVLQKIVVQEKHLKGLS